jgi:hypothetical protein
MSLLFTLIAIGLAVGMLLAVMYEHRRIFNIPIVIVFGCSFLGPVLGDVFSEKREYIHCCLAPWSIRKVLLSKCIVWMTFMIAVPLILLFGSSFFFDSTIGEYRSAVVFFITSIPVFLILGTRISIVPKGGTNVESSASLYLLMFLTIPVATMPYAFLYFWFGSLLLSLLFSITIFGMWYAFMLPAVIKKLKIQHYNLEER